MKEHGSIKRADLSLGLSDPTPLGKKLGSLQISSRPLDPVLLEKLRNLVEAISKKKGEMLDGSVLSIRSIDGFYFFENLRDLLSNDPTSYLSVVEFDPVRRTFLVSGGKADVTPILEYTWFSFEAFPEDNIIFLRASDGFDHIKPPDKQEKRVDHYLSMIRDWKGSSVLTRNGITNWKGKVLDELKEYIERIPEEPDQSKSQ